MNKVTSKILKILYISVILLFLYLPLLIVVVYSFNTTKSTTQWSGFTLDWYVKLFNNKSLMVSLANSIMLSLAVTTLAVIFGTLGSIALNRYKTKLIKLISPMLYLPVLTPEIIVGIAFLQLFSMLNFKFGMFTLILSHFSFCVPFVTIVVSARFASLPNNLEEAARDLGATKWQAFFHVTIPELLPGILSGAALAFIMSFDDVIISFFMSGVTSTTFPVKVYSMMRVGVSPEINALSTIVLIITFVCICIINFKKSNITN